MIQNIITQLIDGHLTYGIAITDAITVTAIFAAIALPVFLAYWGLRTLYLRHQQNKETAKWADSETNKLKLASRQITG